MPHESIYTEAGDKVSVGWSKDGHVQVASSWEVPAPTENPHGVYVDLDNRRQINDLIRTLRKARDQAFGRDE